MNYRDVEALDDVRFIVTSAPPVYDYTGFGTARIATVGTNGRKEFSLVAIPAERCEYQIGRYGSGLHGAFPIAEWNDVLDLLDVRVQHVPRVTRIAIPAAAWDRLDNVIRSRFNDGTLYDVRFEPDVVRRLVGDDIVAYITDRYRMRVLSVTSDGREHTVAFNPAIEKSPLRIGNSGWLARIERIDFGGAV